MNVTRARSGGMGQVLQLPEPTITDIMWQQTTGEVFPEVLPPQSITPPAGPAPSVPAASPIYATFGPPGTLDPTAAQYLQPAVSTLTPGLPPGPAPRVSATPTAALASIFTGSNAWMWILGVGGLLLLTGGRRRR